MKEVSKAKDGRLDQLEGRQAVHQLQHQELMRRAFDAEENRREAHQRQMEHSFELRSMLEKLSDRVEKLEAMKKEDDQVPMPRNSSTGPKTLFQTFDEEWRKIDNTPIWKAECRQNWMSQLSKRKPELK